MRLNLELKVQISQSVDSTNTLFSVITCPKFYGFCTIFFTDVVDNFISCLFRIVIVSIFFGRLSQLGPDLQLLLHPFDRFYLTFSWKFDLKYVPNFTNFRWPSQCSDRLLFLIRDFFTEASIFSYLLIVITPLRWMIQTCHFEQ